ncbi:HTH-type transcriptional regulator GltC [Capillimicrobium parvum]|uniref:HTH-type transcriptional regulator GltC n=2 Tax=Capillimicrobium parvum TaxID=2884022 RepID=A0A9E6XS44_9ACTN|nr:HTH-type transcriptional regulator GltC [Capillimicrobium parvum]
MPSVQPVRITLDRPMELRQLEYLVAVARHGQFTSAADALWLTQSALSQQVRRLEAELGVALLQRTSRGVVPTAAGEELLVRAERVLAEVAAARSELARHAGATRGRVRVAATIADAPGLPAALAAFHREQPDLQIALRHASADEVVALLARGAVDVALTAEPAGALPGGVERVAVAEEPLHAMLPAGDPLAATARLSLGALSDRPFILGEPGSALRATVLAACQAAGYSPVPLFELGDPAAARHLVAAGLAVAVAPASWFVAGDGAVERVTLAEPAPRHRIALLAPATRPSPPGRLLLAHLTAALAR